VAANACGRAGERLGAVAANALKDLLTYSQLCCYNAFKQAALILWPYGEGKTCTPGGAPLPKRQRRIQMRKHWKKISLSRETLRALNSPMLAQAAGGATISADGGCNSACACTVTCHTNCAGITCLPCQGTNPCTATPQTVCC
jgi:hypothetical protein